MKSKCVTELTMWLYADIHEMSRRSDQNASQARCRVTCSAETSSNFPSHLSFASQPDREW
jgi:hypothetical protein